MPGEDLAASPAPWLFAQSFGVESEDGFSEEDIFTSLAYSHDGNLFALGDKGGRVTVFRMDTPAAGGNKASALVEYTFLTEFQSHNKSFDKLNSHEISPEVRGMKFWPNSSRNTLAVTCNDKTIKLWKLCPRTPPRSRRRRHRSRKHPTDISQLRIPSKKAKPVCSAVEKRHYKGMHSVCAIDSLSVRCDGEAFISQDALQICLMHPEHSEQAFSLVNLRARKNSVLSQIITSATMHPKDSSLLVYSTNQAECRLLDMRESALMTSKGVSFQGKRTNGFYSDVVETISSVCFAGAQHLVTRDYMTTKLWDVRKSNAPVAVHGVHDFLQDYYKELHSSDCLFDRFDISCNGQGDQCATGSYDDTFVIHDSKTQSTTVLSMSKNKNEVRKAGREKKRGSRGDKVRLKVASMDFAKKSLRVQFHPRKNIVAVGSLNRVYLYRQQKPDMRV